MPEEGGVSGFTRKVIGVRKLFSRQPQEVAGQTPQSSTVVDATSQNPPAGGEDADAMRTPAGQEEHIPPMFNPKEITIDKRVPPEPPSSPAEAVGTSEVKAASASRFDGKYAVEGATHRATEAGAIAEEGPSMGDGPPAHELTHVSQSGIAAPDASGEMRVKVKFPSLPDEPGDAGGSLKDGPVTEGSGPPPTAAEHEVGHWQGTYGGSGQAAPDDKGSAGAWAHLWGSRGAAGAQDGGFIGRDDGRVQPLEAGRPGGEWVYGTELPADPVAGPATGQDISAETDTSELPAVQKIRESAIREGLPADSSPDLTAGQGEDPAPTDGASNTVMFGERPPAHGQSPVASESPSMNFERVSADSAEGTYIGRDDGTVQPSEGEADATTGQHAEGQSFPGFSGGVRVAAGDINHGGGGDADLRVRVGAEPGSGSGTNEMDLQDTTGREPEHVGDSSPGDPGQDSSGGAQPAVGISFMQRFRKISDGVSGPPVEGGRNIAKAPVEGEAESGPVSGWQPNPRRVDGQMYQADPDAGQGRDGAGPPEGLSEQGEATPEGESHFEIQVQMSTYNQAENSSGEATSIPFAANKLDQPGDAYQGGVRVAAGDVDAAGGVDDIRAEDTPGAEHAINRTGDRAFFVDETGVIRGQSVAPSDLAGTPEPLAGHGYQHNQTDLEFLGAAPQGGSQIQDETLVAFEHGDIARASSAAQDLGHAGSSTLADLGADHLPDLPDAGPDAGDIDADIDHHDLASKLHDLLDR